MIFDMLLFFNPPLCNKMFRQSQDIPEIGWQISYYVLRLLEAPAPTLPAASTHPQFIPGVNSRT